MSLRRALLRSVLCLVVRDLVGRADMGGPLGEEAAGLDVNDSYVKLKMHEWTSFKNHLSQWEYDHTLDC